MKYKGKSKHKIKAVLTAILFLLLFAATLLITFGGNFGVPNWDTVFTAAGITDICKTDGGLTVHFIDVGKGDSIFINSGEYNILIDSGLESFGGTVKSYLERRGVKKLDLVIATHQDEDHIGDMSHIIEAFDTDKFIMPQIPQKLVPNTECYDSMLRILNNKNIDINYAKAGDNFTFGDVKLDVIAPVGDDYSELNDFSVVIKLTYGENTFLFTGDAEEKAENDILSEGSDISADVLKAGHHGSSTSTLDKFLDAVSPLYAVVSIGENDNNLPKKSVIKRLENAGAKVYRTDDSGTVVFICDGEKIEIKTEK